jgi:general secretion pathway protein C
MNSAQVASFLRGNGWVLNLVFVALSSYFVAGAANAMVARSIRVVPSIDDAPPPSALPPTSVSQRTALAALADRNLLALKREQLTPAGGDAGASAGPAPLAQGRDFKESELQQCTVNATLRATLVADTEEWSMAVIVSNVTHEPAVYTINEGQNSIADDATLVAVRSREIVVRRRDHFERCLGEGEVPGAPGAPMVASVVPPTGGSDEPPPPIPGDMTGVTKLSETDYKVERTEVDRVLGNLNEVATQARIVPSFKNGKANGFKLFSIRPGSIYSKIGLQNGDVIQKINGYDMNSPDRALEIYTKLRDATSLTIELQRRGNTQTMNYAIN